MRHKTGSIKKENLPQSAFKARVFDQPQPVHFSHDLVLFHLPSSPLGSLFSICGMTSSFPLHSISENCTRATGAALQIHLLLLCMSEHWCMSFQHSHSSHLCVSPWVYIWCWTLIRLHLTLLYYFTTISHGANPSLCMFLSMHDLLFAVDTDMDNTDIFFFFFCFTVVCINRHKETEERRDVVCT